MSSRSLVSASAKAAKGSIGPALQGPTLLGRQPTSTHKDAHNHLSRFGAWANPTEGRAKLGRFFDFARVPVFSAREADRSVPASPLGTNTPGSRVPGNVGANFERTTGASLDRVRVHTGTFSHIAAEALQARAFTVGSDIHFADGEFRPGSPEGDHLIAHELTHTVQQRAAAPTPHLTSLVSKPEDLAEQEAEAVAEAVTAEFHGSEGDKGSPTPKTPSIRAQASPIALAPKKKPKHKTPKPPAKKKPIVFHLFSRTFTPTVDAQGNVTVPPADGWTFTDDGPGAVLAERTLDHAEYVAASGSSDPIVERTRITIDANNKVAVDPIQAVLGEPAKLTIPLGGPMRALKRTSLTVNGSVVEQLDVPAAAITFTPADGDSIHLGLFGEAWVFTTLKQDSAGSAAGTTDVKGFFHIGDWKKYIDYGVVRFGSDRQMPSETARRTTMEDLADPSTAAARRISSEEADAFKTVAVIEGDFANSQTWDSGILTFGFAQWTVNSDLPRMLTKVAPDVFERHLGRYGLAVSAPVRQLDRFVLKFVPHGRNKKELKARALLGVRNPSEKALFLNGRELVTEKLLAKAASRATELDGLANLASALKADVVTAKQKFSSTSKSATKALANEIKPVRDKLTNLAASLKGLPGLKKEKDPEALAETLHTVADDASTAAKEVNQNCDSSQVMRKSEWALRFQLLGQDPGGQDAELAQARETFTMVKTLSTHGATYGTLLPNNRGRAALLSSYLNTPSGTQKGMSISVDNFKAQKRAEAKTAAATALAAKAPPPAVTEADWIAFPWKATDKRWSTVWPNVADQFEKLAIVQVTSGTTNPKSRRKTIAALFP